MHDADAAGRAALDRRGLPRPRRHRAPAWRPPGPARWRGSPAAVESEIGITVSVGLSLQQVPRQDRLRPRQAARLLGDRPGRGAAPSSRRAAGGDHLGRRQGLRGSARARRHPHHRRPPEGRRGLARPPLWRRGPAARPARLGIDARRVKPDGDRKCVSAETTFDEDLDAAEGLMPMLCACPKGSRAAWQGRIAGKVVTLKLKTADFRLRTRARALHGPPSSRCGFSTPGASSSPRRPTGPASG